jgi:acetoin utilization deacetylase AcuC-like enzyme
MATLPSRRRRFLAWLAAGGALAACGQERQNGPLLAVAGAVPAAATAIPETDSPAPSPTPVPAPTPTPEPPPEPTAAPAPAPPPAVPVFYRPEYALAAFSFETTRKARWVADSLAGAGLEGIQLTPPDLLTEPDLLTIHDPGYVTAVRTGQPRWMAETQGFRWDPGMWPMVLASNGGAVAAALAAMQTGIAGSLSSGMHHARRARGNGYCTFNGLVLAARTALAAGAKNVLIVDLDAHCGGGTNELIGSHPNVWIVDVAVNAFDRYAPVGHNTLDVVTAARDYLPTVRSRLQALPNRAPAFDVCLYNAGMDPHEGCPIGGLAGITRGVLLERESLVFDWCRRRGLPLAFVLAGGYVGPRLTQGGLTDLHRLTLAAASQFSRPAA